MCAGFAACACPAAGRASEQGHLHDLAGGAVPLSLRLSWSRPVLFTHFCIFPYLWRVTALVPFDGHEVALSA